MDDKITRVTVEDGQIVVQFPYGPVKRYDANEKGALLAKKDILAVTPSYMCSSNVNFPEEYGGTADVTKVLRKGFTPEEIEVLSRIGETRNPGEESHCRNWKDHDVPGRGYCKAYRGQVVHISDCDDCLDKDNDKTVPCRYRTNFSQPGTGHCSRFKTDIMNLEICRQCSDRKQKWETKCRI